MTDHPDELASTPKPIWQRLRESVQRFQEAGTRRSDPQARSRILAERAHVVRSRKTTTEKTSQPSAEFLAFRKGGQRFAISLSEVAAVDALEQYTGVPGAPGFIRGVIHWRGAILAMVDLERLFEIPESGLADLHAVVVVEAGAQRIAVAAGEVEEIVRIPEAQLQPAPEVPGTIRPEWVLGVHDENRLILNMVRIVQDRRLVDWRDGAKG